MPHDLDRPNDPHGMRPGKSPGCHSKPATKLSANAVSIARFPFVADASRGRVFFIFFLGSSAPGANKPVECIAHRSSVAHAYKFANFTALFFSGADSVADSGCHSEHSVEVQTNAKAEAAEARQRNPFNAGWRQ
jgi:hypothetical protein